MGGSPKVNNTPGGIGQIQPGWSTNIPLQEALKQLSGVYKPTGTQSTLLGLGPQAGGIYGDILKQVGGGLADATQTGLSGLQTGATTGFLPDIASMDALLRPALERGFTQGAAALREQGALTGNISSSGLGQQITDLRGGLESGLQSNLAGILGQALPQAMQNRFASSGALTSLPQSFLSQPLGLGLSVEEQLKNAPLSVLSTLGAALGGGSSTVSPSTGQQLLGAGTTLGGAALGGYLASGAGKGAAGSGAAAGAAAACWVAEATFGKDTLSALYARRYVRHMAPKWFRAGYMVVGPTVAKVVKRSKIAKAIVRPLFTKFALRGIEAA